MEERGRGGGRWRREGGRREELEKERGWGNIEVELPFGLLFL